MCLKGRSLGYYGPLPYCNKMAFDPLEMFEEEALAGLGDLVGRTVKVNPSQLKHIVEGMHMLVSRWT